MLAKDIRQKYIDFFVRYHNHKEIPSASLLPENDPTVLFTTAGMHPLVPYLMGEKHPLGTRLVDCQKCVRTDDIEEVGDATHCTFFEMLGNWSLGDYFKDGAIKMSMEFLTSKEKGLGLDKKMLAVTCFRGDENAPKDEESAQIWRSLGIDEKRIAFLPKKDNWWGPAGQTGPCGPDTEMFYWTGEGEAPEIYDSENKLWVEIWNDVFMQYNKKADGSFEQLKQKNVDTGLGLERVTAILQGRKTHYETELFSEAMNKINELKNVSDIKFERIIADHIRSAVFILGDEKGVTPSNTDQGYILRRLIRRGIRCGRKIGINGNFTHKIAEIFIKIYEEIYNELRKNKDFILEQLVLEEERFEKTLEQGEKEFTKIAEKLKENNQNILSGRMAFKLYDTYGFPLEMTKDLASENNLKMDEDGFNEAYKKHQELSRKGAEQKFSGGLSDHSEETTKLHTATHLLQASLRKVLGEHVYQRGSNITAERLRFDFSHPEKISDDEIKKVEDLVNSAINQKLPVSVSEMSVEEAKRAGALGVFEAKYGEKVKVYTIGKSDTDFFSKEICGGPHVKNTSELGGFKILKEEASSAGVRRIKGVVIWD
ncbi:MAG: Alanine-tRNA ligase [Candidatus Peregrinibacteria bacterium GW2011_GWA2_33_10]|nr:MAG: Alanine-tRNA ligase [Candidatus Peregrinibacteria bacterium GW2011_GWA2_33_10]KKP38775.1 MAG: alanyl-tRNA synthetase, alanyl-tRNA synthetase [Candidatus Peregrinibacteria bacterium GW2011_GWC2_33_13]OGJ49202.1 MAG: alanine--tRNA ligase [Candidatus Peregrinibacteria bacterium RIFOXYA2_FULL_33_7]